MDKDFQDRIDRFLLHGSEMTKEERAAFLGEIENDEEKKAQYQFTIMVRDAMRSRMSKLEAMKVMEYFDHVASADNAPAPNPCMPNNMPCPACPPPAKEPRRNKRWYFLGGIAALFVVGFFLTVMFVNNGAEDVMRGSGDQFDGTMPAAVDSLDNDTADVENKRDTVR